METCYVDGRFVHKSDAFIPVDDLAVLRGLGVFDLIRASNGRPCFFKEHIRRLIHSAEQIGLALPWTRDGLESIALETLKKNSHLPEANIRIIITGGSSPDFMTFQGTPRLIVLVTPFTPYPETWYRDGVKVITITQERDLPDAKSTSYITASLGLNQARQQGAVEALYVNQNGEVLEGTTSNLFAFIGHRLVTPDRNILKGVTREAVLKTAAQQFSTFERTIYLEELMTAEEIFITGTNKGIVPVVTVDDRTVGSGKPGQRTREIRRLFDRYAGRADSDPN